MSFIEQPRVNELVPCDDLGDHINHLYQLVDNLLVREGPSGVAESEIQRLLTLGLKLYVARREQGAEFSPVVGTDGVTATEAAVTVMGLLKAVNLDLFELSLWRHWGKIEANDGDPMGGRE